MSKLVTVTKLSSDKWSVGIREHDRDVDNTLEFPVHNANYNPNNQRFTPKDGKTLFWGDGDDRREMEWVEILGSDKKNAGALQYACRELRFKKPNKSSYDRTPEKILHNFKLIEGLYEDLW